MSGDEIFDSMGQRISYFKTDAQTSFKELLLTHFADFRSWYVAMQQSVLEEFNDPLQEGEEQVFNYLQQHPDLRNDFDNLDQKLLDELTSEFVGVYCDRLHSFCGPLEMIGPCVNKWKYIESTELVIAKQNQYFIRLWNFLLKGRSLKDDRPFDSYSDDYKIGFLSFSEHQQLKAYIETYFGNRQTIPEIYWTDIEKEQLQKAIKEARNGHFLLANHHPKTEGLELVLQTLNDLNNYKGDLITGID